MSIISAVLSGALLFIPPISTCSHHATNVTHEKRLCVNDASVSVLSTPTTLMTALHTVKTATEENDNGDGGEKEKKK